MTYRFALVSAMFNVARYLPDYFASLDAQTHGLDDVQIILVDDGSSDDTFSVATAFAAGRSNVTVLQRENGGQAAARNTGLEAVTSEWVSFPDPDDVLDTGYLKAISDAIDSDDSSSNVYAARVLQWDEVHDVIRDNHALGFRTRRGDLRVDLESHPTYVQPHVHSAFFRTAHLIEHGLRFDERMRLRFEDGSFVSVYLLSLKPTVHYVASAEYRYRHRADGTSTVQSSALDSRKYTDTIRYGYLGVIEASRRFGHERVPQWAQNLMLYDQFWQVRSSFYGEARNAAFDDAVHEELAALLGEFLDSIDESSIIDFKLLSVSAWMRDLLLLIRRGSGHEVVRQGGADRRRGLVPFEYSYCGATPVERIWVDGVEIEPRHAKDLALEYVGRPYAWKRTLWVAAGSYTVIQIDGERYKFTGAAPTPRTPATARRRRKRKLVDRWSAAAELAGRGRRLGVKEASRRAAGIVASRAYADRFKDAWMFIDRDVDSNDSAEVLYWWVARNRPEINAWFVVRPGTPDWARLSAAGARLVPYGTPAFYALLRHAKHLASSHADKFITDAMPRSIGTPKWAFTFLQHGVIKGDISRWLNTKRIDLFVTSTQAEYDYITGPSPFKHSTRETRLLGLPRFDALLEQDATVSPDAKKTIVIAPTWRDYLVGDMSEASNRRAAMEDFLDTTYATNLTALLSSDRLKELSDEYDAQIVFLPHPNMRVYIDSFDVPEHVKVQTYDDEDVRALLARAAVLVTDYSSISFNLAYLQRPTVYFQFDREEYSALHTERPGYFVYERDGFGPVHDEADGVIDALGEVFSGTLPAEYTERMRAAFPVRDGRNAERVFEAMRQLTDSSSAPSDSTTAFAPDNWADAVAAGEAG